MLCSSLVDFVNPLENICSHDLRPEDSIVPILMYSSIQCENCVCFFFFSFGMERGSLGVFTRVFQVSYFNCFTIVNLKYSGIVIK